MSKLTIYRASAGSGKTFRLTAEYLKILFSNPRNYKRILAVTFTNKATAEMKSRIIRELDQLARQNPSPYLGILENDLNLTQENIQKRAKESLSLLLHDFSKFSISTIDKFFQKIIRSFTHETGIQPGYRVELNQAEILSMVVDNLLMEVGDHKELKELISSLAESKIEQGRKWEFKEDILNLAREIFKEEFKAFDTHLINKFNDKTFLKDYIAQLQNIQSGFENHMKKLAAEALTLIKNNGLTTGDFKHSNSSVPNYYNKIIDRDEFELKPRTLKGTEDYGEWISKTSPVKDVLEEVLDKGLFRLHNEAVSYHQSHQVDYYSAKEILRFIHSLGILTDISTKLHEYCEEQNIFLISDAAQLLKIIIDNNDAPFIYEKTGSIYRFFMMDEFQDTSTIQWENFKPLIGNSLAQGNKNLVVGDVKQSIYRWRNSDWEILSEKIEQDFQAFHPVTTSLNTNWRSRKNIIDFNNSIFHYSSRILQQHFNQSFAKESDTENPYQHKITEAYQDVIQQTPAKTKHGGYIYHAFIREKEKTLREEKLNAQVIEKIELLQDQGYALKDIAIIVRKRDEGQRIANALIEHQNNRSGNYRYDFISNDSLFIANASIIRFILAVMEYLLNEDEAINRAFLGYEYHQYIHHQQMDSHRLHSLFKNKQDKEDVLSETFAEEAEQLKQLPVYELVEKIIRIFKLNKAKAELPYLKAFMDLVLEFGRTKTADIHSFITWWHEEGQNKTLSVSENQDAIRIITIHLSKGLEFKNVILPYANWNLDHNSRQTNILWCSTEQAPFNRLDIIPVQYARQLGKTVFKNQYLKEKFHAYVDNLNLLYVAFTRAEENLFIWSPSSDSGKKGEITDVGSLLHYTYTNYRNFSREGVSLIDFTPRDDEATVFEHGTMPQPTTKAEEPFLEVTLESYESYDIKNKLRLKLHDHSFFTGKESKAFQRVNHGKMMHEIFEYIETEEDIPEALDKILSEGKISHQEKEKINRQLKEILKNPQIKGWFSKEWKVKTEAEIILPGGAKVRPDRVIYNDEKFVVIDYKFGEQEEDKHKKQVKTYMKILQEMGNPKVEGYLWYVDLDKVVAVL
ncbi:MAG: UvrD-helicase domain-containing protein [Bacteroidales bacterium]|jgi:ATP-dependent exoDNAse (exonuclease V) beta subunit|nr:UvrD-helicase domain-containing protein [Bacteroidales bacterium]